MQTNIKMAPQQADLLNPEVTFTPIDLLPLPSKDALRKAFVGKHVSALRTPAIIVNRRRFQDNCERMAMSCKEQDLPFRAHVKTHKTAEGLRYQLEAGQGCSAVICSTVMECWQICRAGLVREGLVKDVRVNLLRSGCLLTCRLRCCMACQLHWTRWPT